MLPVDPQKIFSKLARCSRFSCDIAQEVSENESWRLFLRDTQSDFVFCAVLCSALSARCRGVRGARGARALVCVEVHLPSISKKVQHICFTLSLSWLVGSFISSVCL